MGRTLWEWERLEILKTIPAHQYHTATSHMRLCSGGYRISVNDRQTLHCGLFADGNIASFRRHPFFYRRRTAVVLRRRPVRHMQHAQGSIDGDARRSTYEPGELLNAAAVHALSNFTHLHNVRTRQNLNQQQAHGHIHKNKSEQQKNIQQLRGAVLGRELLHSRQHSR